MAQYQFDFAASVPWLRAVSSKDIEGVGSEDLVKSYIDVGDVLLQQNHECLVDYKINQLKSDNKSALTMMISLLSV